MVNPIFMIKINLSYVEKMVVNYFHSYRCILLMLVITYIGIVILSDKM